MKTSAAKKNTDHDSGIRLSFKPDVETWLALKRLRGSLPPDLNLSEVIRHCIVSTAETLNTEPKK
jgi:hypothetical protein